MLTLNDVLSLADADALPPGTEVSSSSHRVHRLVLAEGTIACKRFVPKHGDELEREWFGLSALAAAGVLVAPQPLGRSASAIAMSWCEGVPIDGPSDQLRIALTTVHRCEARTDVRARTDPGVALDTVRRLARDSDGALPAEALSWLASDRAEELGHTAPNAFVRSDGNLRNAISDGSTIRLVDFEDCGLGDWVTDVADMVEHAQSRGVDDARWSGFFDSFSPTTEERRRFDDARRLFAIGWLALFEAVDDVRIAEQRSRVARLLSHCVSG